MKRGFVKIAVNHHSKTIHHRKPRSQKGTDHPDNLVEVDPDQHWHYHAFFGVMHPEDMARKLNKWTDPDYEFFVRRKK